MSTATAHAADVGSDVAPARGKKKLILIIVAALLVVLLGGGAAVIVMKKNAAAAAAAEDDDGETEAAAAADARRKDLAKNPPTFVALDAFVVNLADRETDRFAQIGITLEVEDAKFAETMKAYMPAIRNGILMVLAHKTSAQLLSREGKLILAREIMREAVLPLGIEVSADEGPVAASGDEDDEEDVPRRKTHGSSKNPVKHVHFSNFIVQ